MKTTGRLNRDVTQKECFWLDKDYKKGTPLKICTATFGCVTDFGDGVYLEKNDFFLEIPKDAIDWD